MIKINIKFKYLASLFNGFDISSLLLSLLKVTQIFLKCSVTSFKKKTINYIFILGGKRPSLTKLEVLSEIENR